MLSHHFILTFLQMFNIFKLPKDENFVLVIFIPRGSAQGSCVSAFQMVAEYVNKEEKIKTHRPRTYLLID